MCQEQIPRSVSSYILPVNLWGRRAVLEMPWIFRCASHTLVGPSTLQMLQRASKGHVSIFLLHFMLPQSIYCFLHTDTLGVLHLYMISYIILFQTTPVRTDMCIPLFQPQPARCIVTNTQRSRTEQGQHYNLHAANDGCKWPTRVWPPLSPSTAR